MTIQDITNELEKWAPLDYAEDFDNTGLLVGDKTAEVTGILVTLDCLEIVLDEAIEKNCNLVVSFHPILFSGLKKITGKNYVERAVTKAIKNDIAIYAIHTALDNHHKGVNDIICDKLGLENRKILIPQEKTIKKLTTYVPEKDADSVRNALFKVGAGNIGNYSNCSFNSSGTGTFRGNEVSNPVIGERGKTQFEQEIQLNITFSKHLESKILQTLFKTHPYEEVAYEIVSLENLNQQIGIGMTGELPTAVSELEFLDLLKKTFHTGCVRHSEFIGKSIKKVAVLGGSGAFAIEKAKQENADVLVTADLKYHDFFKAEKSILLADIGHYESEQFTKNSIHSLLTKKIRNFAPALPKSRVILSETNTNPIH
ncbi:MAG TPA: Nif3-like dinuclear metal center hexameric protein, partial [Flavobacteriaceae bacterium]|nr:Nif3-like dinuclear metal center hexameric protein [Flavobacteriaceae bacterium]